MASRSLFPFFGGSPADPFMQLRREMDRLFDDVFRGYGAGTAGPATVTAPRIDMKESEHGLEVCADLPGVEQKDLEVTVDDDVLTIRGEKKAEKEDKDENYHVMERTYGSFARSVRLPYAVNPDEVRASFENGVLTVTLPKPQERQQRRRIEVTGAAPSRSPRGIDRAAAGDKPGAPEASAAATARSPEEGQVAAKPTGG